MDLTCYFHFAACDRRRVLSRSPVGKGVPQAFIPNIREDTQSTKLKSLSPPLHVLSQDEPMKSFAHNKSQSSGEELSLRASSQECSGTIISKNTQSKESDQSVNGDSNRITPPATNCRSLNGKFETTTLNVTHERISDQQVSGSNDEITSPQTISETSESEYSHARSIKKKVISNNSVNDEYFVDPMYERMVKLNLPEHAIRKQMIKDGVLSHVVDFFFQRK